MSHRFPRRARRVAAVGLLVGLSAALLPPSAAHSPRTLAPAAAFLGQGDLSIRIDKLTPVVPTAKSTLRLAGVVTNTSDQPMAAPAVALRVSPTPLYTRSEISAVLSGDTTREGVRIAGTTKSVSDSLAPGESAHFEVSAPFAQLELPRAGAYVVAAEALGDGGAGLVRQDLDRTFLGWWPEGTNAERLGVTLLWPLSQLPDRDTTDTFLTDQLGLDVSPAGRLANLVDAGAEHPGKLTWLVDPEVLQAAEVMSQGYRKYQSATSKTKVTGTRTAEAAAWLADLRAALRATSASAVGGLYATPDLDAARTGRALANLLSQREAVDVQTAATLRSNLASDVAYAPGGNLTAATISQLAAAGVESVVLSDTAVPTDLPLNYTPSGASRIQTDSRAMPALLTDSGLTETLAMPAAGRADIVALRQRWVAETLVTALERPNLARVVAATPALDWSPSLAGARAVLAVLDGVPWVKAVPLNAALAGAEPVPARTHAEPTPEQTAVQLPADYVRKVRANQRGVTSYRRLVTNPDDVPLSLQQAPGRQLSAWLRGAAETRDRLATLVGNQVRTVTESVDVISSGAVTISGSAGTIPVTVSNQGDLPVTVGLVLSSNPPILFQADPVAPFEIAAGKRTSVEVPAKVAGSSSIAVEIQLVTATGTPIGESTQLLVKSAAYAQAARLIVQSSLVLLVVAVLVHGVRRARRMSGKGRGASSDPT
ncbi:MAG: DUF6049 family protein [Candidatus Nanopelagicales bacterium]